jgi:flagellar hook-basal body complex protein FliE
MSPIGSVNPLGSVLGGSPLTRIDAPPLQPGVGLGGAHGTKPTESFGQMLDGLVSTVESKETNAQDVTRKVLLGESSQLHQSMIAMQEASVAFSMMVEVRNKLVESYQELMRMQV